MDDAGFIITSYVLTLGGVAVYAYAILRRGRRLAEQLPDDDKPWVD